MFFFKFYFVVVKMPNFSRKQRLIWIRRKVLLLLAFLFYVITPQLPYALGIENQSQKISRALVYADAGLWDKAFQVIGPNAKEPLQNLIEWLKLRSGEGSVTEYIEFIESNPYWPGMRLLRQKGERKIYKDFVEKKFNLSKDILKIFLENKPQTGEGLFIYAKFYSKFQSKETARKVLTDQWLWVDFSDSCLIEFLKEFVGKYGLNVNERIEELLWKGKTSSVEQLVKFSLFELSQVQKVRLQLQKKEKGVDVALAQLSEEQIDQAGVILDRFRFRLEKNLIDSASKYIVANSKRGKKILGRPDIWANYRVRLVKHNTTKSRYLEAYEIASQHYLSVNDDSYSQLEWLSGFIAYQYLGDHNLALRHFQNSLKVAVSPETKSKLNFFIGKAFLNNAEKDLANDSFSEASKYFDTVHGQLAHEILNKVEPDLKSSESENNFEFSRVIMLDTVKVGLLLSYAGRIVLGDWFLQHSIKSLTQEEKINLLNSLNRTGHHLSVISIMANNENLRYENLLLGYPIPYYWKTSDVSNEALYLAVAREESKFYLGSKSTTGALGLMQLMPKTAQMMSQEVGLPYLPKRLRSDWNYNFTLGVHYIEKLLKRYQYSFPLAIAAYNAGPSRVNSWLKAFGDPRKGEIDMISWIQCIPFDETRGYVSRVLASSKIYEGILNGESFKFDHLRTKFVNYLN